MDYSKYLKHILFTFTALILIISVATSMISVFVDNELLRAYLINKGLRMSFVYTLFIMMVVRLFIRKKPSKESEKSGISKVLFVLLLLGFISFQSVVEISENVMKYTKGDIQETNIVIREYKDASINAYKNEYRIIKDQNNVTYRLYDKKDDEKYSIGNHYTIQYVQTDYNLVVNAEYN